MAAHSPRIDPGQGPSGVPQLRPTSRRLVTCGRRNAFPTSLRQRVLSALPKRQRTQCAGGVHLVANLSPAKRRTGGCRIGTAAVCGGCIRLSVALRQRNMPSMEHCTADPAKKTLMATKSLLQPLRRSCPWASGGFATLATRNLRYVPSASGMLSSATRPEMAPCALQTTLWVQTPAASVRNTLTSYCNMM